MRRASRARSDSRGGHDLGIVDADLMLVREKNNSLFNYLIMYTYRMFFLPCNTIFISKVSLCKS